MTTCVLVRPELDDLEQVLGHRDLARRLASAPGGWRDLSQHELAELGFRGRQRKAVLALQRLVRHGYPELPSHRLVSPHEVGRIYAERLGGLLHEVMIAVGLDGQGHVIAEIEVASGGKHSLALTSADVLRPLIRAGASAFILVHNHPSGDPTPSPNDVEVTEALGAVAGIVGIPLVDHVVIARGGAFTSMLELGHIDEPKEKPHEHQAADPAL